MDNQNANPFCVGQLFQLADYFIIAGVAVGLTAGFANFLQGVNDDEIGVGESKTYYVATKCITSESGDIDNTYTISLPGNNNVEFIKPYNEPMFKNKHIYRR